MTFDDNHTCQIKGISTVRIQLFDEITELKDVSYVYQLEKNLILLELWIHRA